MFSKSLTLKSYQGRNCHMEIFTTLQNVLFIVLLRSFNKMIFKIYKRHFIKNNQ